MEKGLCGVPDAQLSAQRLFSVDCTKPSGDVQWYRFLRRVYGTCLYVLISVARCPCVKGYGGPGEKGQHFLGQNQQNACRLEI